MWMTPQTSISEEGGTKWIQIETWRSYAWFHFSEKEFILDKKNQGTRGEDHKWEGRSNISS